MSEIARNPRPTLSLLLLLSAAFGLAACDGGGDAPAPPGEDGGETAETASEPGTDEGGARVADRNAELPVYVDVSDESGLVVHNHTGKPSQKDWIVSGMGGGSIVLDYDVDGDMDLFVVDGTMLTAEGKLEYDDAWRSRLFRNDGDLSFTEVTKEAGIDIQAFGFGGASADYDADGYPDLYVCCWGRNFLLRNRGDGTFEDVTEAAGLLGDERDMSTACAWGDVNGDGVLDLYVANYADQWALIEDYTAKGIPGRSAKWRDFDVYVGPTGLVRQPDRLYFGSAEGVFRDVTETNLPQPNPSFGFQPVMFDADLDGDLDVFVANDTLSNFFWLNDGTGRFEERGREVGLAMSSDSRDQAGMGVDVADPNRDGRLDLIVTHFSHDYNTLYINRTRPGATLPNFKDSTHRVGAVQPAFHRLCWGTRLYDYDNDGILDLFVACGHVYGEIDNFTELTGTSYEQQNLLLRGQGAPAYGFEDVTDRGGPGLELERVWRGAAFADFDDDGDMDVFVTALNGKAALLRNDGGNRNNFVRFRLEGAGGLRSPAGARVTLTTARGETFRQELHHGASFCNDNDPRLLFGLGSDEVVPKVEIRWPDGTVEVFEDVAARKLYRVRQGSGELEVEGAR